MRAICITLGEQSENHVGMVKQGDGLADNGFSVKKLNEIKNIYESVGGEAELIDLNNVEETEEAGVLILRNGVDVLIGENKKNEMFKELLSFEWDKTYWDNRRKRWLNKHARYNVCFGNEAKELNEETKSGTIISYDSCPILKFWKSNIEDLCKESKLEAEGNYYYNMKKTGIGFHGDAERKKVIACNLSDNVEREIHWQWYKGANRIGERIKVKLNHGDCYIMSEKATGFDWKKRNKLTLRHAAGCKKYLN